VEEDCVILDIPEGVRLNLLGLVVQIDRVLITADRAGLLGGLLASLTCGGAGAADQLDALAQMVRAREIAPQEPAEDEEQAGEEEPAEDEEQAGEEEPAEDEEQAVEEEPAQPRSRRGRGGRGRA
jgi:cobalamin biosynthesis protein CobT